MLSTRRQPGDRRWGLSVDFPLQDSSGFMVLADRRRLSDRRNEEASLAAWAALLSRARQENN